MVNTSKSQRSTSGPKARTLTLISLMVIVPIGFASKFYAGPASNWANNSLGGLFYEIFWCLLVFLLVGRPRPWLVAAVVLAVTCFLETLQLWHPPFLEFIRSFLLGRTLLGHEFAWSDFPYYFLGAGIGWLWMRCLSRYGDHTA